jgi:thiol:disulfide interchange protein DsbD
MIPITISFFTKQAEARGGNVLPLSLLYGAGIVLIFVVIGVAVGPVIMAFATHPVTNLVLGSMFVLFAAALFGAITLNPPNSMMNLAGKASMTGGLVGVFLMGMTLVLTSFTCTAPFVGSLLSFAAGGSEGGSLMRIVVGMGTFGLTMAVPFTVLSLLPGKMQSLPSSGEWMDTLKVSLGFVELAAALKFFSNTDLVWGWGFLSRELFLLLWALIFAIAGAYLMGWIRVKGHGGETTAGRMLAATFFLLFGAYCWHGYKGNEMDSIMTAIIPPYSSATGGGGGHASAPARKKTHEIVIDDLEAAKKSALAQSKPVLINFTGFT